MSGFLVLFVTGSICAVFIVILSIICRHTYEVSYMTKTSDASSGQGLMANPELSNILKNSLCSQVNVSIGTAGVVGGSSSSLRSWCVRCSMVRSGDAMALGGEQCDQCGALHH